MSLISVLAPELSSSDIISAWPRAMAHINGVLPSCKNKIKLLNIQPHLVDLDQFHWNHHEDLTEDHEDLLDALRKHECEGVWIDSLHHNQKGHVGGWLI